MRFLLVIGLLILGSVSLAQTAVIELSCVVKDDNTGKKMPDAKVTITTGGTSVIEVQTDSTGKAPKIQLDLNKNYEVLIHKEGYISKLATIDARFDNVEDLPPFVPFPIQVSLFEPMPHDSFEWLASTPMIKFKIDQYGNMGWDMAYTRKMLKKIALVKEGLPSNLYEEYIGLSDAGDLHLKNSEFEKAKEKYTAANEVWASDRALKKIDECDLLIDKRDHPEKYANESEKVEEK